MILATTEVSYGPEANTVLEQFIGCPLRSLVCVANKLYATPKFSAYKFEDGRVLVRLYRVFSDNLYILDSMQSYYDFENTQFAYDPEDSRKRYR